MHIWYNREEPSHHKSDGHEEVSEKYHRNGAVPGSRYPEEPRHGLLWRTDTMDYEEGGRLGGDGGA